MLDTITPVNDVFRKDLAVDATLVDPLEATGLEAGEFLKLDTTGKWIRLAAGDAVAGVGPAHIAQVFSQKGDLAAQSLNKVACLKLHQYEAETDMFFDGGAGFANGTELTVKEVTIDTVTRSALTQAAPGDLVHAISEKDPATNDSKLRYVRLGSPYTAV
jgi:hypothetical protein